MPGFGVEKMQGLEVKLESALPQCPQKIHSRIDWQWGTGGNGGKEHTDGCLSLMNVPLKVESARREEFK